MLNPGGKKEKAPPDGTGRGLGKGAFGIGDRASEALEPEVTTEEHRGYSGAKKSPAGGGLRR